MVVRVISSMRKFVLICCLSVLFGCGYFSQKPVVEQKPTVAVEEAALDTIEHGLYPEFYDDIENPVDFTESAEEKELDPIINTLLEYGDWFYFGGYCLLALVMAWFVKKSGQQSQTFQQIQTAISNRLPLKHRLIYRILRYFYKKKVEK